MVVNTPLTGATASAVNEITSETGATVFHNL